MERPKDPIRRRLYDFYMNYVRKSDWGVFLNVKGFRRFFFFTNTYCNLHCEHCTSSSNLPDKAGHWEIPISHIERFFELFGNVGMNDFHRLIGGETTAMPIKKLEEMIELIHSKGRILSILTNGFRLLQLEDEVLNKIDEIVLDDHGINQEHLKRCKQELRQFYKGKLYIRTCMYHYDLDEAIEASKGFDCGTLMTTPTLYKSVIYPCCNMGYVVDYHKDFWVQKEFVDAGWSLDNDDLPETLKHWKETIPKCVMHVCLNKCWQPHVRSGTRYKISLKRNDVIAPCRS